ncbi:hypothetical protein METBISCDRAFT_23253 [Metschnikowia bicuspidata]|uniref:Restriction of telomere capping protein 4 n=1 Tax=Metschnikowia bicuspidata TaxID=27322 RepID=A0A4P9ZEC1_9ASCO|nr:hypothetical protein METBISCDRAFT_23253 [Metschnikowia bicuspidata]
MSNHTPDRISSKRRCSTLAMFENARRPRKKKGLSKPYVFKKKPLEKLIAIKPAEDANTPKTNFEELDELLKPRDFTNMLENAPVSLLPLLILQGDINSANAAPVRAKYASKTFPLPKSKQRLKLRVSALLPVVKRLLEGAEELSYHYTRASAQRKLLKNATMSSSEHWDVRWDEYVGGFYGFRRQAFISELIQAEYADLLPKIRNKTISYWSPDMFCMYVLANEIILRLIMEDMQLLKQETETVMKETADYGCHIADEQEFTDDLNLAEFQVL